MASDAPESSAGAVPRGPAVDPHDIDVRPDAVGQLRDLPPPDAVLKEWGVAALRRVEARPPSLNVILEPVAPNEEEMSSPHSDPDLWWLQLADAFGTRSKAVITTFLVQLESICPADHYDEQTKRWRINEQVFSAALMLVK